MNSRTKASSGKAIRYCEVLPLISICLQIFFFFFYTPPNIAPPYQTTKAVRSNIPVKFSTILWFRVVEDARRKKILSKYNAIFGNNLVIFLFGFTRKQ